MRRLDLIPPEVMTLRRQRALLRRGGAGLGLWAAFCMIVLMGLHSWQRAERGAVRAWEARVDSLRVASQVVEALQSEHEAKRARVAAVQRLEAQRPVTGIVAFVTPLLPLGLKLESLVVEPALVAATMAAPGSATYFAAGAPAVLGVQLRGTARGAAEVAELLRKLETCGRFRRAQLLRVDRPPGAEGGQLRFEMHCEL